MSTFISRFSVIHSPFGAMLTAIRENEIHTTSLGYNPDHYKLIAFVLSAALQRSFHGSRKRWESVGDDDLGSTSDRGLEAYRADFSTSS